MSTAAAPKRVSFGSHKSMVETLIIDIDDDFIPSEERIFYQQNLCHLRHSKSSTAAELSTTGIHQPHSSTKKPTVKRSGSGGTIGIDNPFAVNGELRRKADFILRHSRISRADLQIVDPDSFSSPEHMEKALPSAVEETIRLEEVPLRSDNKREDTVTLGEATLDREPAQKDNASEVVDPARYNCGTQNRSDQPNHVPETGTMPENRTLPDPNHDSSQIQSKCDVQLTDTVCTRKGNPIVVVDSVSVATSPEYQQAEQVKLTSSKCKCCNVQ